MHKPAPHAPVPNFARAEPLTDTPRIPPAAPSAASVGVPRLPSLRVTAVLAAGMLALGVALGAAIGPAPATSVAGISGMPWLLPLLAQRAAAARSASSHAVAPPAAAPQPTPTVKAAPAVPAAAAAPASSKSPTPTPAKTPASGGAPRKPVTLPAITSVWLIELSGTTLTQALAAPTAAPYIDSQLVPAGTLLSAWSGVDAGAFAGETSLLAGAPPQTLDTIVQPPCPEGAPGAACAPESAGAVTAADTFLSQTLPSITALPAYSTKGLIVISFGSVGSATASGLPAGAATSTLSSEPAGGVLLLSPFARAGAKSAVAFNPTSPKQSLEKLLHQ